jgi:hypothetical protein
MPEDIQPRRLADSGRRPHAAGVLHAAVTETLPDLLATAVVIDVLDAVSTATLRSVGLGNDDARAVLAVLWADPNGARQ